MARPRRRHLWCIVTAQARWAFVASDPIGAAAQAADAAWQNASAAAYQGLQEAREIGQYAIAEPRAALFDAAEFVEQNAIQAWQDVRNIHAPARMVWNQITGIWQTPCEDSWTVLIETALPAFGSAMWLLLQPSPDEVLEEYLQPKAAPGAKRGPRGKQDTRRRTGTRGGRKRRWPSIPDPDSLIAGTLPFSAAIQGRDVGNGERWLFEGIQRLDRIRWHFLLLDAASTFFYHWSSGLMEARFCSEQWDVIYSASVSFIDSNNVTYRVSGTAPIIKANKNTLVSSVDFVLFRLGGALNDPPIVAEGIANFARPFTLKESPVDTAITPVLVCSQDGTVIDELPGPTVPISAGDTVPVVLNKEFPACDELFARIDIDGGVQQGQDWSEGPGDYLVLAKSAT